MKLAAMALALMMLLAGPAQASAPPGAAAPNPAHCPAASASDTEGNERKGPLPVPARYSAIVKSNHDKLAVLTLTGGNFCQDIASVSEARNFALSTDKRFYSFDWLGYEENGHVIIDRTGNGQAVDTGVQATISPSGRRFAAVQFSESGFGALEGFAVWQIDPVGVHRLVLLNEIPSLVDWRIDSWAGENCINLSGIPNSRIPASSRNWSRLARDRYVASPASKSWRLIRATGRGCPAA